ncbi:serine/threonine protein kinase [Arthrobacter pityocampae]|uniref:non-specific serine/threonine protein kinase n=1 Tax=Arthrobacter pityocampae TaxID=547334 RepID=A0A2S5IYD2_9MICC|nr:serine/threonine-protein kinase [Arthrobacter pityocampae]PPB49564.1 serine/threonine protein kinase [Arthrobacter pityocampae]
MEKQALAGRYALGERVGSGGMADVFAARDTRLQRDVAIKLFRPGISDGIERGSAEARMLAGLDHPGLVRVLDMDTGDDIGDDAYLVVELVDGPDLGVLLRSGGPLGTEDVRLMALDLARTLQYIHGRGIVHRDVKPSNVLTRPADADSGVFRFLLTDFGIARFFDGSRMTATGQVVGSAAYFSPEQTRGDGVGQSSDIYSLGLVLIEALTGERAFPGTGVESALARLHRSPSIPHAAGPALSDLLVAMTLDDPDDRPDAARVVRALTSMGPQHDRGNDSTVGVPVGVSPTTTMPSGGAVPPAQRMAAPDGSDATTAMPVPAPATAAFGTAPDTAAPDAVAPDIRRFPGESPRPAPGRAAAGRAPAASSRQPSRARAAGRRRHVLPWLVTLLVVGLLAAALWVFTTTTAPGSGAEVEPLPAVPGETGEKLQELYDSVQR